MLHIKSFTFNDFQEQTYLLYNENKQCWIIDPGMYFEQETAEIIAFINNNNLVPQAIFNTHAHIDHIFGIQILIDTYKIPFGIHQEELPVLDYAVASAAMFGLNFNVTPKPTFFIKENKPLMLGEDRIEVRFCPGHSIGSIAFYYEKGEWVISGDVLFSGSIGRTDLPGGNFETLLQSIHQQLFTLPLNTKVFPGHGASTTIQEEKMHNPFL